MNENKRKPEVTVECRCGPEAVMWADEIASLRIAVFREYPYLYDGSVGYEREYLQTYFKCPESVCILARAEGSLVGVSTALPMEAAEEAFAAPFRDAGFALDQVFYFGESVLLPEWRGRGVGHRFFDQREQWARGLGKFRWTTFCAVEREPNHAARPPDYRPHDAFWSKRGYIHRPDLTTRFAWKELGADRETLQGMSFWIRDWKDETG